jgi:tRNA pseudouridine55 synthase
MWASPRIPRTLARRAQTTARGFRATGRLGLVSEAKRQKSGVLVIDKPRGPTSHDAVARVRRALGVREIGHSGTLDPMATGVLVLAIGEATKLVPYLTVQGKSYEATIALGVETDTLDVFGKESARAPVPDELREALMRSRGLRIAPVVAAALEQERTRATQVPPEYSAIRKGGERAYARARRGEKTELEPRPVSVNEIKLLDAGDEPTPWVALSLDVSKGYYVRALARDFARALGTVGHLSSLRRTRSGQFHLAEALPLDTPADELEARVLPLAHAALRALPVAYLSEAGARDAGFGRRVAKTDLDVVAAGPHAWLDPEGKLVAVGEILDEGFGHVLRGFGAGSIAPPPREAEGGG